MADRILVTTEEMEATVSRYNDARDTMDNAFSAMDAAWDHLQSIWDGEVKAAFMAEWIVLMGNIRKSDNAMAKSIQGLIKTNNLFQNNEGEVTSRANNLNVGTVPPMF